MAWQRFLQALMGDPRVVKKISESWPIRRAAQKSVAIFLKAEEKGKDILRNSEQKAKFDRFTQNFTRELKEGMKGLSYGQESKTKTPARKLKTRRPPR